jgi:hypothetical protein
MAIASCTTAATRATGHVDSASAGQICFKSENGNSSGLIGCWPVDAAEIAGLQQGDCVSAELPHDPSGRITAIRKIDGTCDLGVQRKPSTQLALGTAAWFVVTGALIVVLCFVLPRRRNRRIAEGKPSRRNRPANTPPVQVIDEGEPVEVTVVDVSELRHRSD